MDKIMMPTPEVPLAATRVDVAMSFVRERLGRPVAIAAAAGMLLTACGRDSGPKAEADLPEVDTLGSNGSVAASAETSNCGVNKHTEIWSPNLVAQHYIENPTLAEAMVDQQRDQLGSKAVDEIIYGGGVLVSGDAINPNALWHTQTGNNKVNEAVKLAALETQIELPADTALVNYSCRNPKTGEVDIHAVSKQVFAKGTAVTGPLMTKEYFEQVLAPKLKDSVDGYLVLPRTVLDHNTGKQVDAIVLVTNLRNCNNPTSLSEGLSITISRPEGNVVVTSNPHRNRRRVPEVTPTTAASVVTRPPHGHGHRRHGSTTTTAATVPTTTIGSTIPPTVRPKHDSGVLPGSQRDSAVPADSSRGAGGQPGNGETPGSIAPNGQGSNEAPLPTQAPVVVVDGTHREGEATPTTKPTSSDGTPAPTPVTAPTVSVPEAVNSSIPNNSVVVTTAPQDVMPTAP